MNNKTLELEEFVDPENMAVALSNKWVEWDNLRHKWLSEKKEIQEYIFATDTSSTTNQSLPWKNKVHIPKLCHIRDNLHANYMATLFPSSNALVWEGDNTDDDIREKRETIQNYMGSKLRQSKFRATVSKLVLDYIDYGNVFAMTAFEAEYQEDPETKEQVAKYIGPRLIRIAPEDIVFNPTASEFNKTPKIIRSLKTLGSIKKDISIHPELGYYQEIFDKIVDLRGKFAEHSQGDFSKNAMFDYDGFSGFWDYFNSDYVEILDFYGDYYDAEEDKLYENYLISVVDKAYIIRKQPLENWQGEAPIRHAGWRQRQNNLYAMGPLDNLVGIQHRIDHLENCKADAWDQFIHPMPVIKGEVMDFEFGPGERIYAGDDGDVDFLRPDVQFMMADNQIAMYEQKMEEMAGAPKEAVGFRTPGEKTAYEVQVLENGANKVFINKVSYLEEIFLEPCLNDMLESARRNLNEADVIRMVDDATQAVTFEKITRDDIVARGKIRPMGARHFAQNATTVQNLTQLANSPMMQDPTIRAHISGKRMAHALEYLLGVEQFDLIQENINIYEMGELQQLQQSVQQVLMQKQTAGLPPEEAGMVAAAQAGLVENEEKPAPPR